MKKVPDKIVVSTKALIQVHTKVNLYVALYGVEAIEMYLDAIQLRMSKRDGKHVGGYIVSKVCQEYQITRYDLFESAGRKHITEARQLLCVFAHKYLMQNHEEISSQFHRSRHFAKRMIGNFNDKLEENHPFDKQLIERYHKLDSLISAYMDFKPILDDK